MLLVVGMFILVNYAAQRLAMSETSRGLQYFGLGLAVVAWSVLVQPLIWMVVVRFGNPAEVLAGGSLHAALSGKAAAVLGEATLVTLAIFGGLTATVFITRKDFSFLRGIATTGAFAMFGVALAATLFGFHLGVLYCAFGILVMSGYILFETSQMMSCVRPTQHVAAALLLFTTIVSLFIYVLRIVAEMNRR
jgi:FtsH-binding integral membrane protein